MSITRRNFVAGSAVTAGLVGLAACSSGTASSTGSDAGSAAGGTTAATGSFEAPDLSAYPIEADGDDVEALWTSETLRKGKWVKVTNPDGGATIGVMDEAKIIQVDGLAFRDMNGDGKLEAWEDWRQTADVRAQALAESLTADQIYPLLWAGANSDAESTTTDANNNDLVDQGSRAGVSRLQSSGESYATDIEWINTVQQICEESELGIPYLNYSDPYVLFNVPNAVGLAACMDKDIWRKAGMWQARAWRATGVRCDLGPQIDVYSQPIGTRCSGSVCEDPALNRDFAAAFGGGMQSTWGDDEATDDKGWGEESCAVMLKHFVGEGVVDGGRNDHMDQGKWNLFTGSNFNAHLIPFLDGGLNLDSSTKEAAAMMPCYGIAYDPNNPDELGECVGSGYSTHNISILRNAGWDGMLTTDWLILEGIPNGVRDLTVAERYAKMMKNSISQHGGSFEPDLAEEAYKLLVDELGEDEALKLYQENARRIFKVMLNVQLFDQPYSDPDVAKAVFENQTAIDFGNDCADKSIIMLKNKDNTISADGLSGKVYIPQKFTAAAVSAFGTTPSSIAQCFGADIAANYFDVVTDTVGEASGEADEEGNATFVEDDITRLTSDELADVKYAIVYIDNPADAYQGNDGGDTFMNFLSYDHDYDADIKWKPVSLQYRPFTADGDYVPKESLNPEDEYGEYENRSCYGEDTYATNESDLDLVISVKEALPEDAKLILCVKADRPMCFYEVEPYADAILLAFDVPTEEAFAHIISGQVEPSGLLTFQMPKDMQTVFEQDADVPRDMECYTDADGNTYDFCFGLNWSGVIDDDRVATYKVDPLTTPETTVQADSE